MKALNNLYWFGTLLVVLAAWVIFRVIIRRDYRRRGSLSITSTALEFVVFALHANLPYLYLDTPWPQFPPLPENSLQLVLGFSIGALGALTTLAIMTRLSFSATLGQKPVQLAQKGPYRWTRNPQLLSYGLLLLGCVVLYPSWEAAVWLGCYGVVAHLMVLTEEEHLGNLFGVSYFEYCRQVPRYLPLPGKKKGLFADPKE